MASFSALEGKLDIDVSSFNIEFSATASSLRDYEKSLRKFIVDASKHGDNIRHIYKETLRSMINIFSNLYYRNAEEKTIKISCTHANPERTIAKLFQETNIILPLITVSQTTSEDDDDRRRNNPTIIHDTRWNKDKQRAERIVSLVPRPVNIRYDIHVWTKYKSDIDQIAEQVRQLFNPSLEIVTSYNDLTKAFIDTEQDASELEVADREDRLLRKTFSIVVEGYIPSPRFLYTSTGEIEKIKAQI